MKAIEEVEEITTFKSVKIIYRNEPGVREKLLIV